MRQTRRSANNDSYLERALGAHVYHKDNLSPLFPSKDFREGEMIPDDALRQHVYRAVLKVANRRLEQAIPGSSEGAFAHLSLAGLLNLLFLVRGEWGSIGDFVGTQRALRATVGDELLWADPQERAPASPELIQ
jgi:hypothetical protein